MTLTDRGRWPQGSLAARLTEVERAALLDAGTAVKFDDDEILVLQGDVGDGLYVLTGGMVKVTMTGRHEVKRVQIDPSVLGEDREMLEDLIAAATNDAVHRVESASQAKMSTLMGGMSLPPGMKLPF